MTDRKKVMQALKCCSDLSGKSCAECTYVTDDFCLGNGSPIGQLAHDALELLKEQEPVKPIVEQYALPLTNTSVRFIKKNYCGICKEEITGNNVYCHKCGRMVMWDD